MVLQISCGLYMHATVFLWAHRKSHGTCWQVRPVHQHSSAYSLLKLHIIAEVLLGLWKATYIRAFFAHSLLPALHVLQAVAESFAGLWEATYLHAFFAHSFLPALHVLQVVAEVLLGLWTASYLRAFFAHDRHFCLPSMYFK